MAEFLNPTCPVCLRSHPVSVWERVLNSEVDHLGIVQRSGGRGQFEVVGRVYQPEQLDWVKLDGFDISIRRESAPFGLLKSCFIRALSRWVDRGWLTDKDLRELGLERPYRGLESLISVSRTVVAGKRDVKTTNVDFEL